MNSFNQAGVFLVNTLFELYILTLLLRIILQWAGASFFNPICKFIVKVTDPVTQPLRRVLPRIRVFDLATLIAAFILEALKFFLIVLIATGAWLGLVSIVILSIAALLKLTINIFFYAILISAILSWVNPNLHSPITEIIHRITEPLLAPARRLIPPIAGFDISPIPVMIALQLLLILLVQPLMAWVLQ